MQSIGLDIVDTSRIDKGIKRFKERYLKKILGPDEISLLVSRHDKADFVAGRFAAKEALIKALGKFLTDRPPLTHLQVISDQAGQPIPKLPDYILEQLNNCSILISITHEKTMAAAMVVITEEK